MFFFSCNKEDSSNSENNVFDIPTSLNGKQLILYHENKSMNLYATDFTATSFSLPIIPNVYIVSEKSYIYTPYNNKANIKLNYLEELYDSNYYYSYDINLKFNSSTDGTYTASMHYIMTEDKDLVNEEFTKNLSGKFTLF